MHVRLNSRLGSPGTIVARASICSLMSSTHTTTFDADPIIKSSRDCDLVCTSMSRMRRAPVPQSHAFVRQPHIYNHTLIHTRTHTSTHAYTPPHSLKSASTPTHFDGFTHTYNHNREDDISHKRNGTFTSLGTSRGGVIIAARHALRTSSPSGRLGRRPPLTTGILNGSMALTNRLLLSDRRTCVKMLTSRCDAAREKLQDMMDDVDTKQATTSAPGHRDVEPFTSAVLLLKDIWSQQQSR